MTSHSTHIASDCEHKNLNILYKNAVNEVKAFSPFLCSILNDREKQLLKRYIDATRSELFFASAVLFVEGASEQFIIPTVAKKVYGINLTEHNISIIPIYSRYFEPYLKLTHENNFEIPAAAIIDGDTNGVDHDELNAFIQNAQNLQIENRVLVCVGTTTLEIDLFPNPQTNIDYLRQCFINLGHEQSYNNLVAQTVHDPESWNTELINRINNTVKKGRFAQELSLLIDENFVTPVYIRNAITHIANSKNIVLNA